MSAWVAVAASDITDRWRPLSPSETEIINTLIEDAQDGLETELEAWGVTKPDPSDRWRARYVRTVAHMVRRFLINPEGYISETGEDGYTYRRADAVEDGAFEPTDDEVRRLRPLRRRRRAFTIVPS